MEPHIPAVLNMMQSTDYGALLSTTTLLYYLSDTPSCRASIVTQATKVMKLLNRRMVVPYAEFDKVAVKLAANLVIDAQTKREVMLLLPAIANFMEATKSKDNDTQVSTVRFLSSMADTTDEAHRAELVTMGVVRRLRVIVRDGKKPSPQMALAVLRTHLKDHFAAIRIQAVYRGWLQR